MGYIELNIPQPLFISCQQIKFAITVTKDRETYFISILDELFSDPSDFLLHLIRFLII